MKLPSNQQNSHNFLSVSLDTLTSIVCSSVECIFQFLLRLYLQLRTDLVSTHVLISGKMIPYRLLKHTEAKAFHPASVLYSLLYPGLLLLRSQKEGSALPPQPGSNRIGTTVLRMALPIPPHCCQHAPAKQDGIPPAGTLTGCTRTNPGPNSSAKLLVI